MKKYSGFTLIEILLVAGIISVLLSLIFFNVSEARKKANDAHMKAESGQVARAIYQYREDNGGMVPGHLIVTGPATLVEGSAETGDEYRSAMQELVSGGYLSEIPTSPSGQAYAYVISADETEAVFAADLTYEYAESQNNSCPLTDTEDEEEPSCTPPPPYPPYYGGSGYNFHSQGPIPGTCSSGQLMFYATSNGYTCVDNNSFNRDAYCTCSPAAATNPSNTPPEACTSLCAGGGSPKAFLWSTSGYSGYYTYLQELESYNDQVEEYDSCMEGGDEDEGICDGSSDSDYCSCI